MIRRPAYRRALLLALFVTVLWSSSWVIIRIGLDDEGLDPITFAGLRYAVAAIVLAGVTFGTPRARAAVKSLSRGDLGMLAVLGVSFFTLTQGAQFIALDNQPAATSSLVLSMTPLVVVFVSGHALGEPPEIRHVVGALLVAAGAGLYFAGSLGATLVGMSAAVVGLAANAGSSLLGRSVNRSPRSMPLVTTTLSMGIGASLLLAGGAAVEGIPDLSAAAWVIVVWLAVVNTALAFTLWNMSLRHLTATESSVINNTMLVQIAILGWLFLSETPSLIQLVGIAIVTVGITGSQRYSFALRRNSSG